MSTMTMERLDEIAAAWRRGLDSDELANPAGPLFGDELYTEYDISATGTPIPETRLVTFMSIHAMALKCICCPI